jgi:hypothetical protein
MTSRHPGGRPSTPWVEIQERPRYDGAHTPSLVIRLSTSLYAQAGSPARLDVQRIGGQLCLTPARGDHGYKVMANSGGIRINASGARDVIGLAPGKYAADWHGGMIVIGPALPHD